MLSWVVITGASSIAAAFLPPLYGGVIHAPLPNAPLTLDPVLASRSSELQVVALLYDTLFVLNAEGQPRPHLVQQEAEVSADGRIWRLKLRPEIKLWRGRTLGAADVAHSLRRMRKGQMGYLLAMVTRIAVEGQQGLTLHLSRKTPELPRLLSAPCTAVAIKRRGKLVGTGPFRLRRRSASRLSLVARSRHFAGRPFVDALHFKLSAKASAEVAAFQVGGLQVSLHGKSLFGAKPRHGTLSVETAVSMPLVLAVGRDRPFLKNLKLRRALLTGIDRKRLSRLASTGRAAASHGPLPLAEGRQRETPFNRGGARRLLQQGAAADAALAAQMKGGRLRLSLLVDASQFEDTNVAGQIVADLDRIGVAVAMEVRPASVYQKRLTSGRFELALRRVVLQIPQGSAALAGVLSAAGQGRLARRCMAQGRCGAGQAKQFMKKLNFIPLVHTSSRVFYDGRLGSFRVNPRGTIPYADIFWKRR